MLGSMYSLALTAGCAGTVPNGIAFDRPELEGIVWNMEFLPLAAQEDIVTNAVRCTDRINALVAKAKTSRSVQHATQFIAGSVTVLAGAYAGFTSDTDETGREVSAAFTLVGGMTTLVVPLISDYQEVSKTVYQKLELYHRARTELSRLEIESETTPADSTLDEAGGRSASASTTERALAISNFLKQCGD